MYTCLNKTTHWTVQGQQLAAWLWLKWSTTEFQAGLTQFKTLYFIKLYQKLLFKPSHDRISCCCVVTGNTIYVQCLRTNSFSTTENGINYLEYPYYIFCSFERTLFLLSWHLKAPWKEFYFPVQHDTYLETTFRKQCFTKLTDIKLLNLKAYNRNLTRLDTVGKLIVCYTRNIL